MNDELIDIRARCMSLARRNERPITGDDFEKLARFASTSKENFIKNQGYFLNMMSVAAEPEIHRALVLIGDATLSDDVRLCLLEIFTKEAHKYLYLQHAFLNEQGALRVSFLRILQSEAPPSQMVIRAIRFVGQLASEVFARESPDHELVRAMGRWGRFEDGREQLTACAMDHLPVAWRSALYSETDLVTRLADACEPFNGRQHSNAFLMLWNLGEKDPVLISSSVRSHTRLIRELLWESPSHDLCRKFLLRIGYTEASLCSFVIYQAYVLARTPRCTRAHIRILSSDLVRHIPSFLF